ncbi:putative chitinase [Lysobacter sp. yr284]|uniref:XVIPCD domain-containing protein n=1 Tax=Lysobacter sp. yr284 TaxID=1761791 RepID=UPI0008948BF3|nr:XVIPCD domain-containing protein [Lysobacter sp. yr284]SDY19846.1 putative chitinase [Lysobacter sp. yr284]
MNSQDQQLRVGIDASSQTLDEVRRAQQRNLLSSPSHPQHDLFSQVRVCLDRQDAARQFSPGERDNLAGALLLEATRERQRVDGVAFSQDGKRAFAIEGDADSPTRRISYVDTEQAAQQSLQRSSEQFAQLAREQDVRDQQRQTERERDNERQRQNPERNNDEQQPQQSAAARALTRERD